MFTCQVECHCLLLYTVKLQCFSGEYSQWLRSLMHTVQYSCNYSLFKINKCLLIHTLWVKKDQRYFSFIYLPNVCWFSKFFRLWIPHEICNKTPIMFSTTPSLCNYTTLWNLKCDLSFYQYSCCQICRVIHIVSWSLSILWQTDVW